MIGRTFDGFDAMLFAYDQPVLHAFHMRGVPVQLYIAFFDAQGVCFDHVGMFRKDAWEYTPPQPYQWALEMPVGDGAREGTVSPGGAGVVTTSHFNWLNGATLKL